MDPLNVLANCEICSFSRSWDNRFWAHPGYAHAPFFQNFSWAFIPMDPLNVLAKFEICSFPRSW